MFNHIPRPSRSDRALSADADQNTVREVRWDGMWYFGDKLDVVPAGSALGAVTWAEGVQHIRIYYQDHTSAIRELCKANGPTESGWSEGTYFRAVH